MENLNIKDILIKMNTYSKLCVIASVLLLTTNPAYADNLSGNINLEVSHYQNDPVFNTQYDHSRSISSALIFERQLNNGMGLFSFHPFIRIGDTDKQRNHFDIRELMWAHAHDSWEFNVGISKVYWGITESQQLTDIINQTDRVEGIDGDDKLGQPILSFSKQFSVVNIDLYILPGFRERIFPGKDGNMKLPFTINSENPTYESNDGRNHVDVAFSLQGNTNGLDYYLSYFWGTSRDPSFNFENDLSLTPYYPQIQQIGLALEYLIGDWIFKFEAINREGQGDNYFATTSGFEYTLYGVFNSAANITLYAEYLFDERDDYIYDTLFQNNLSDGSSISIFEDDAFVGIGINFNRSSSGSEPDILATLSVDRETKSKVINVEGRYNFDNDVSVKIEAIAFRDFESYNYFSFIQQNQLIKLSFVKLF